MINPETHKHSARVDLMEGRSALFASGLWLRVGTVGAFGIVGILHQMFIGEMQPLSGLALAAGVGALVVMSWWRARAVLDSIGKANGTTVAAPSPARRALGGSVA
jgi:hypothetical protein